MNNENAENNNVPVTENEDVEFNEELADAEDLEAQQRSNEANQRVNQEGNQP